MTEAGALPNRPRLGFGVKILQGALIPDCREQFLFRKQSFLTLSLPCLLPLLLHLPIYSPIKLLCVTLFTFKARHSLDLEPPPNSPLTPSPTSDLWQKN